MTTEPERIRFQINNNYNSTVNHEFNSFLNENYLDENLDIYMKQNNEASCVFKPSSTASDTFPLQEQQKFITKYINQTTPYRGLLVWHGLGSGKTCASIAVANTFKKKQKVVMVPAALENNFIGDYLKCGNITAKFQKGQENRFVPIGVTVHEEYGTFHTFTSNGHINRYNSSSDNIFENKLVIIDESQLLIEHITNAILSRNNYAKNITKHTERLQSNISDKTKQQNSEFLILKNEKKLMKKNHYIDLYKDLRTLEKSKIICLSGTPIVNTSVELLVLFNIIHGDIVSWIITAVSDIKYTQIEDFVKSIGPVNPETIKFRNNIDLKNSKLEGSKIIIYKNPYEFINENIDDKNAGVIYDDTADKTCTNKEFTDILKHIFGEFSVTEEVKPLFDIDEMIKTMNPENFNTAQFKNKINGLASYFGNIQKILPSVKLTTVEEVSDAFLSSNNLYKYGIGEGNNSQDLYEIRYVNNSIYLDPLLALYNSQDTPPILKQIVNDTGVINNNTQQFVYPETLDYIRTTTTTIPMSLAISKPIKQLPSEGLESLQTIKDIIETRPKITAKELQEKRKSLTPFIPDDRSVNSLSSFLSEASTASYASQTRKRNPGPGPTNDKPPPSKESYSALPLQSTTSIVTKRALINSQQYQSIEPVIKNIWNKDSFMRKYGEAFKINDDSNNLLKQCSPKIFEIIKCILNNQSKIHIIYSEYLQINIPLVRALQANGFDEYKGEEMDITKLANGLRYMFYTGTGGIKANEANERIDFSKYLQDKDEGKSKKNRDDLLKNFNNPINRIGEKIQVIIINSAAAEGITIRNVRFVHLLHLPVNMSKLFQIVGRAIRNCTHQSLDETERTVTPILYLDKNNEKKYEEILKINRTNIPFLDILKESTIDCRLNQKLISSQKCYITEMEEVDITFPTKVWIGYKILAPSVAIHEYKTKMSNLGVLQKESYATMNEYNQNVEQNEEEQDEQSQEGEQRNQSQEVGNDETLRKRPLSSTVTRRSKRLSSRSIPKRTKTGGMATNKIKKKNKKTHKKNRIYKKKSHKKILYKHKQSRKK